MGPNEQNHKLQKRQIEVVVKSWITDKKKTPYIVVSSILLVALNSLICDGVFAKCFRLIHTVITPNKGL